MPHRLKSTLIAVVTGVLTAIPVAVPAASAAPTLNRGDAAAGWLARQMVDGNHFEVDFGGVTFPDQGLTIDAILAFTATHVAGDYAAAAIDWLSEPDILFGYIGDTTNEAFAGATAKLALAVQVRGGDPTNVNGIDLITVLRGLQLESGQFADRSAFGDFSNAFSQSLAILALARTAEGVPPAAAAFLAATRCPDGGYPLLFAQPTCTSDVDATAMVVQALQAAGESTAAAAGVRWLISVQAADGGFAAAGVENANSTGLAAQALWSAHGLPGSPDNHARRLLAAARATAFLRSLQVDCSGDPADRGAVAFTTGGLDPATAPRATAQAILGLSRVGFAHLTPTPSRPDAPTLACPSSAGRR